MAELTLYGALQQSYIQVTETSRQSIDAQRKMGYVSGLAQSGLLLLMNLAQWLVLLLAIPLTLNAEINGGGPLLYLRTSGGNIYLRKF